jgi:hypothetical protein
VVFGRGQKHQAKLADLHFVAVDQHRRLRRSPVDVGAVEATDIDDAHFGILRPELRVPTAHGDVVEKDVAARMSARRGHRLMQQEVGTGVRSPFDDYQRRTRGRSSIGGRAVGADVSRPSGSLTKPAPRKVEVGAPVTSSLVWSRSLFVAPAGPFRLARWS